MNKNISNSKEVRTAIFEELSQEPRFCRILQKVVDAFKEGQGPIVIESFSTYVKKIQFGDELWNRLFTKEQTQYIIKRYGTNFELKTKVSLNAKLPKPFQEAVIDLSIIPGKELMPNYHHTVNIQGEELEDLFFYGHRDRNYFVLFFRTLGYTVEEGNVSGKYGLLISLGD